LPIAIKLGLSEFRGKKLVRDFFNAMIGVPTVVLGLILYLLISRQGILGFLNLLFTPTAIIIGQALLITPLMISLLTHAIEEVDPAIKETALTLGASKREAERTVLKEARRGGVLATVAGFNRAISELGVALMLGGNLPGSTRVMTTEIARGVSSGNIWLAMELGVILLSIAFILTIILNMLRGKR
jgi:tungstate transport system permease protein